MRFNFDDEAFKNKERGKYGNKNSYFLPAKKQFKIKEDVMIYKRKLRYLILVIFLLGFCFPSFAQAEEKKPVSISLCDCDSWDPVTVRWTEPAPSGVQTLTVKCGDFIPICRRCRNTPIELKFKMNCKPSFCTPSYTWDVKDSNNNIIANGNATAICDVVFDPTPGPQNYTVSVRAGCGNNKCGKCEIKIYTCEIVNCVECRCLRCDPVQIKWMTPGGGLSGTISCGGKGISVGDVCQCQKISLNFKCGCSPNPDECKLTYTWEITGPNTYQLSGGPQTSGNISFIPTEPGLYSITVIPKCGETVCPPCKVNVTVTGIVLCK